MTAQWHDLSLAVGAIASAGASTAALAMIRSHGGFVVNPVPATLATIDGMATHFWVKLQSILSLFGADFSGMSAGRALIPIAHLVAVALVAWGVTRAVRRSFAEDDLGMQVVTASFLVLLAAFMLGYRDAAREAVGLLPAGAVLAGRMLALRVIQARLAPALAAVLACFGLSLASQVAGPALPSPDQPLASWLEAHHLTYGLSAVWYASNGVTLYSHDHVRVRDVNLFPSSELARRPWNTQASWYDPRFHDARFVILNPCAAPPEGPLFEAVGRPAATYLVDGFTVLVWHTNLLTTHPGPAPLSTRQPARVARQRGQPDHIPTASTKSTAYQLMCG